MKNINLLLSIQFILIFACRFTISFAQSVPNTFGQGISVGPGSSIPFNPNYEHNPSGRSANHQTRSVFWVHGLNGDIGSWIRAALASESNVAPGFPARRIKSITNFTYTQSADLEGAAQQLREIVEQEKLNKMFLGENPTQNFIIAHSQGGLVARAMMHLDFCVDGRDPTELGYGGLVSFCSPHQGAFLLNNKSKFYDLAGEMCSDLAAGPTAEKAAHFEILGFSLGSGFVRFIKEKVEDACKGFGSKFVPLATAEETPNITKDYHKGSKKLKEMSDCVWENEDLKKFPKVAFYGIEPKKHLMLRTVKWFLESSQAPSYFEANDDDELIHNFNENYLKYQAKIEEWKSRYDLYNKLYHDFKCHTLLGSLSAMCDGLRKQRNKSWEILQAYTKGVDFLNTMDDKYKYVIGALEIKHTTKMYCFCEDLATGKISKREIQDESECHIGKRGLNVCDIQLETLVERIEYDSDGVVLASSAANLPGVTWIPQILDNSSHMQARNNSALKYSLLKLYEGGTDNFFRTFPK